MKAVVYTGDHASAFRDVDAPVAQDGPVSYTHLTLPTKA